MFAICNKCEIKLQSHYRSLHIFICYKAKWIGFSRFKLNWLSVSFKYNLVLLSHWTKNMN